MGKTEWIIVVLVVGLVAGVAWIRHRRQTGRDSYLPLWRPFVWLAGWLALLLGIIGIFLPGLPTVPFVLLAAGCWSRTSPRFHRWLSEHRMWMLYRVPERWWAGAGMVIVCLAVTVWMWRLPSE